MTFRYCQLAVRRYLPTASEELTGEKLLKKFVFYTEVINEV